MATSSWNAAQTASEILKVVSTLAKVKQGEALSQPDLAEIHCGKRLRVFTLPVKHRDRFLTQLLLCFNNNSGMCFLYGVGKMCFVWKHLSTSEQHCTSMSLQELCNEKKVVTAHAVGQCAENRGSKFPYISLGSLGRHRQK